MLFLYFFCKGTTFILNCKQKAQIFLHNDTISFIINAYWWHIATMNGIRIDKWQVFTSSYAKPPFSIRSIFRKVSHGINKRGRWKPSPPYHLFKFRNWGNWLKLKNVFVKPNEQNKARFNSVMARKGAIKWKLSLPTVVREVKRQ